MSKILHAFCILFGNLLSQNNATWLIMGHQHFTSLRKKKKKQLNIVSLCLGSLLIMSTFLAQVPSGL